MVANAQQTWTANNPFGYNDLLVTGRPAAPRRDGRWLVVFADLMSLLLAFIVLAYSMQGVDIELWRKTVDSLTQNLRPTPTERAVARDDRQAEHGQLVIGAELAYLQAILARALASNPALVGVGVQREDDMLLISLSEASVHDGGNDMSEQTRQSITTIGQVLRHVDNGLAVVTPVLGPDAAGERERSWTQALAYGDAVARLLRETGYPQTIDILARRTSASALVQLQIAVLASEPAP